MNILTLSTYPIEVPRHGGQLRLRSIVDSLRAAGHTVQVAGVMGSSSYPSSEAFDPYPGLDALASQIENPLLMDDWAIGRLYSTEHEYFDRLAGRIKGVPDLIHVEQPWLFDFAQRFIGNNAKSGCKIVYGSENVEHALKRTILESFRSKETADVCSTLVLETEIRAVSEADGVVCVSASDLQWTKGFTEAPVVLAPNGVKAWTSTEKGRDAANRITGHKKFVLYCASAHPPNIKGFFDMFSGGIGGVSPDQAIVVAGGASDHIVHSEQFGKSPGLSRAVISAGVVDEDCLHGLLDNAHGIILPITQGGGTNLKAAEALWSGRHIVSTTLGMRGFESFLGSTGVHVADAAADFKQAVRSVFAETPVELDVNERGARRTLLWDSCLIPLVDLVESMFRMGRA